MRRRRCGSKRAQGRPGRAGRDGEEAHQIGDHDCAPEPATTRPTPTPATARDSVFSPRRSPPGDISASASTVPGTAVEAEAGERQVGLHRRGSCAPPARRRSRAARRRGRAGGEQTCERGAPVRSSAPRPFGEIDRRQQEAERPPAGADRAGRRRRPPARSAPAAARGAAARWKRLSRCPWRSERGAARQSRPASRRRSGGARPSG